MKLRGNTVLVTGGASGIGRCIVQELLARDNTVIVCGRDEHKLQALRQALPQVKTIVADLCSHSEVERLADLLLHEYPGLNGVIHSAAIQHNHLMLDDDYAPKRIEEEVRINLVAPMLLTKLLLPVLRRQPAAFLVNITSGLAMVPKTRSAVYCGTKGGLRIFSQSLRNQLRGTSVRVVELLPPVVDTPMTLGRSNGTKIPPEQVARELMHGLERDKEEIRVGKVKLLAWLQRLAPGAAARVMSRMALLLLLTGTRALAAEEAPPTVQRGVVTDCSPAGAPLFTLERRTQLLEDGRTSMKTVFKDASGRQLLEEEVVAREGQIDRVEVRQHQTGEQVVILRLGRKLRFDFTRGEERGSEEERQAEPVVIGATLQAFIQAHWQQLEAGQALRVRLAVPSRHETVGFTVERQTGAGGQSRVTIQVSPTSPLIAAFVKPTRVTLESGSRRVVEVKGRLPVLKEKEGELEPLEGCLRFE